MIAKVSSIYRMDLQKHDNRQARDGDKKKAKAPFKDVLAKTIIDKTI